MQRNRLFDVLLAIRGRMYSPRGMCKEFRDAVLALVLQVDQKLNEELMGQEVDALMKCVDQHKAMLQDQMLDEVSALRREQEQLHAREQAKVKGFYQDWVALCLVRGVQVSALRREQEQLHAKVQAEVEEREALGQTVEVGQAKKEHRVWWEHLAHGDEFEEVQRKIDSCAQQARTLEIQIAEYHGESMDRIGELEAHTEASEKFAAKVCGARKQRRCPASKGMERAAAKAELDRRLEEAGTANTSKLAEATQQLAQSLAADKEYFTQSLEAGKKEWSEARTQDRRQAFRTGEAIVTHEYPTMILEAGKKKWLGARTQGI
eukprot:scaffold115552_cov20-Tisochrysis_lutea.AAC.1